MSNIFIKGNQGNSASFVRLCMHSTRLKCFHIGYPPTLQPQPPPVPAPHIQQPVIQQPVIQQPVIQQPVIQQQTVVTQQAPVIPPRVVPQVISPPEDAPPPIPSSGPPESESGQLL